MEKKDLESLSNDELKALALALLSQMTVDEFNRLDIIK